MSNKRWFEKIDKLGDITKYTLKHRKKRLIIVVFTPNKYKFANKKCLSFLVDDVDNAQCPGYPACAVEYFESYEEGKRKVGELYKKIGYIPKYPIDEYRTKGG